MTKAIVLIVGLMACGKGGGAGGGGISIADAQKAALPTYERLVVIRDQIEKSVPSTPCQRDASWQPVGLTWNELHAKTSAPASLTKSPHEIEPTMFTHPLVRKMLGMGETPRYPNSEMASDISEGAAVLNAATHIAVLRPLSVQLPSRVGTTFTPGSISAMFMVFDGKTGKYVCGERVDAQSGSDVGYMANQGTGHQAESGNAARADHALNEDLKRALEKQAAALLKGA